MQSVPLYFLKLGKPRRFAYTLGRDSSVVACKTVLVLVVVLVCF
jgi:hypothetical protein